jgi:SAM-dependent methyltransferase
MEGDFKTCIICKAEMNFYLSARDFHYGNPGEWDCYKCPNCGNITQIPIPDNQQLSKYYPDSYYAFNASEDIDFNSLGVKLRLQYLKFWRGYSHLKVKTYFLGGSLFKLLKSKPLDVNDPFYIKKGKYLDFGTGATGSLPIMSYLGWEAEGIEIDEKAVSVGKSKGFNIRCGSHEQLDGYDNYYDYIYSSHAIEHVNEPLDLFKKFYQALKPGGTLAFEIPNGAAQSLTKYGEFHYYLTMPVHVNLFTPKSLNLILSNLSFSNVQTKTKNRIKMQIASNIFKNKYPKINKTIDSRHSKKERFIGFLRNLPNLLKSLKKGRGDLLYIKCVK